MNSMDLEHKRQKAKESETFAPNLAIQLDSSQQYELRGLFDYSLPCVCRASINIIFAIGPANSCTILIPLEN